MTGGLHREVNEHGLQRRGLTREQVINDVLLAAQPTKRFVTTDELTGAFLYLVSDLGASTTGISMPIDGGWTAR